MANVGNVVYYAHMSPSPRREWIEIFYRPCNNKNYAGLPPHGGSGLKYSGGRKFHRRRRLPPHGGSGLKSYQGWRLYLRFAGLPPHGGSGLKCELLADMDLHGGSPSPRREWIEILVSLLQQHGPAILSPSPRREWIEM